MSCIRWEPNLRYPIKGGGLIDMAVHIGDEVFERAAVQPAALEDKHMPNKVLSVEVHRCKNLANANWVMHHRFMDPYIVAKLSPLHPTREDDGSDQGGAELHQLSARTKPIQTGGRFPVFEPTRDNMLTLLPDPEDEYPTLLLEVWTANTVRAR
jgi:hypothetical protein